MVSDSVSGSDSASACALLGAVESGSAMGMRRGSSAWAASMRAMALAKGVDIVGDLCLVGFRDGFSRWRMNDAEKKRRRRGILIR